MPSSTENDVFNPTARRLCPDEACVGVLDAAGSCPVCGKRGEPAPAGGDESIPSLEATSDDETQSAGFADSAVLAGATEVADANDTQGFDSLRNLCPDGTCLGVLGSDGRCNVCGRSAS